MSTDMYYSSSIPGMGNQGTDDNYWNDLYQQELQHIDKLMDEGDSSAAYMYIGTTFLYTLQNFTECYDMGEESNIEHAMSELNDRLNDIQADFKDYYGTDPNDPSLSTVASHNAISEWQGGTIEGPDGNPEKNPDDTDVTISYADSMEGLLNSDKDSGLIDNDTYNAIMNQMVGGSGTVFQGVLTPETSRGYEDSELAKAWSTAWQKPSNTPVNPVKAGGNSVEGGTPGDDSTSSSVYESITDAFTTTSNYLSSQSQTAQSAESYYEGVDEQYMTMQKNSYASMTDQDKTILTNMQSS